MRLHEWLVPKQLMESEALALQHATPILQTGPRKGKRALHLADASTQVLQSSPSLWPLYQRAIAAGHPSEFMRPKRRPASPTAADRVWFEIERLARTLVASSPTPITLRSAVVKVVSADPTLADRYHAAVRRAKRTDLGRSRRGKLGR